MYIAAKALGGKDAEHSANCGVDLISLVAVVGSRFWKPVRTASQSLEDTPLSTLNSPCQKSQPLISPCWLGKQHDRKNGAKATEDKQTSHT